MTVFEGSIALYGWFAENDSFDMSQHLEVLGSKKIKGHSAKQAKAALKCALVQLEKMELIKKTQIDDSEVWVLQRTYLTVEQDVKVSADTALAISEVINNFCKIVDDYKDECDPSSIKEKDVQNLVHICSYFMSKK